MTKDQRAKVGFTATKDGSKQDDDLLIAGHIEDARTRTDTPLSRFAPIPRRVFVRPWHVPRILRHGVRVAPTDPQRVEERI
ncbi:hypothetical protein [Aestuariivita sp.]|jgi:hypothetical protein|uniref:hypothetical protein n=1 Tax=Aestuariivita sp. TaxID=1872407 RepID=UPI002171DAFB|nr:hypothetical protein [Aestuariivita sp.]MCE8007707.1 hypothetical protein [Aestuariivita sp.]